MAAFNLKGFNKSFIEIILVIFQFIIISLHFIKLEFLHNIQKIHSNSTFSFFGFIIILIASVIMLLAIKDLGSNLSPFPRPIANGKLVTSGVYSFMRHPMYYSLISVSIGVFIIKLSIYYLCLTISLILVIKLKINLEEKYLKSKFKNYIFYKDKVKY